MNGSKKVRVVKFSSYCFAGADYSSLLTSALKVEFVDRKKASSKADYSSLPTSALKEKTNTVRKLVLTQNGIKKGQGTGFFITPNILVTARHVIDEDSLFLKDGVFDLLVLGEKGSFQFRFKEIISFSEEYDLALIEVESDGAGNEEVTFLDLSFDSIQSGDIVYSYGYAKGVLTGLKSEVVFVDEDLPDSIFLPFQRKVQAFKIYKPSTVKTNGMSGSPVVNNKGELVGVYIGNIVSNFETFGFGIDLKRGYIVPSAHLEELLPDGSMECQKLWWRSVMSVLQPFGAVDW